MIDRLAKFAQWQDGLARGVSETSQSSEISIGSATFEKKTSPEPPSVSQRPHWLAHLLTTRKLSSISHRTAPIGGRHLVMEGTCCHRLAASFCERVSPQRR